MLRSFMQSVYFVAFALALAVLGPWLDETDTTKDAINNLNAQERFERAAQEVCGPNAAWAETDRPGEIQCFTHKGRKTITAKL